MGQTVIKVGVTGGMGSGKSTVCRIFETLGIPVYYSDLRAKELMQTSPQLIESIKKEFGKHIYDEQNKLNRQVLAELVFQDKKKLQLLNELVHPVVQKDSQKWMNRQSKSPYAIKEAALIFESGADKNLDKVIMVFAPKETRIHRIISRDNTTKESIEDRMKNQMPENEKIDKSDYVIYNDDSQLLIPKVLMIDKELRRQEV